MVDLREIVLNKVSMEDVLNMYNIKRKGSQFCCPFHNDKQPSAKAYVNTFNCFVCNIADTTIGFVMRYFNLDFIQAIQKMNYDFGLGIDFDNYDKEELEKKKVEIQKQKEERELKEKQYNNKMKDICDKIHNLEDMIDMAKKNINPFFWEKDVKMITYMELELNKLEFEFEYNLR